MVLCCGFGFLGKPKTSEKKKKAAEYRRRESAKPASSVGTSSNVRRKRDVNASASDATPRPSATVKPEVIDTSRTPWAWDDGRKHWYCWSHSEQVFVYDNGAKLDVAGNVVKAADAPKPVAQRQRRTSDGSRKSQSSRASTAARRVPEKATPVTSPRKVRRASPVRSSYSSSSSSRSRRRTTLPYHQPVLRSPQSQKRSPRKDLKARIDSRSPVYHSWEAARSSSSEALLNPRPDRTKTSDPSRRRQHRSSTATLRGRGAPREPPRNLREAFRSAEHNASIRPKKRSSRRRGGEWVTVPSRSPSPVPRIGERERERERQLRRARGSVTDAPTQRRRRQPSDPVRNPSNPYEVREATHRALSTTQRESISHSSGSSRTSRAPTTVAPSAAPSASAARSQPRPRAVRFNTNPVAPDPADVATVAESVASGVDPKKMPFNWDCVSGSSSSGSGRGTRRRRRRTAGSTSS